ncbi:Killer toxin, Kp4 [Fusarium austroafricanum]|uniref:Killer toxin, Kp4 n=1 Tax=Fusarium austroafricanum TaxID=2364996 RepID=A0A8H4NY50_9HYPO|nr:Killer toxin, Kp4 [Fusarium austroafricanum]
MHPTSIFQGLFIAFSLVSSTAALGINCRGSANCNTFGNNQIAAQLTHAIDGIDPNRWYNNGQHIACVGTGAPITGNGAFCAFLQGTGGAPGRNIKGLAHFIPEHGCGACGSVPYFFPSSNDVKDGQLTYNYVSNGCSKDEAKLC